MKYKRFISVFLVLALMAPIASTAMPAGAQENLQNSEVPASVQDIGEPGVDYVDGEVLVEFKNAVSGISKGQAVDGLPDIGDCVVEDAWNFDDEASATSGAVDVETEEAAMLSTSKIVALKSETQSTKELINKLEKLPNVETVEPNSICKKEESEVTPVDLTSSGQNEILDMSAKPNDPEFDRQWGLYNGGKLGSINVEAIWSKGVIGDKDMVVAVMGSVGIDYTHEDIEGNIWNNPGTLGLKGEHGYNFIKNSGSVDDLFSSGTRIAGVIGAVGNNGKGISGVCQQVKIMSLVVAEKKHIVAAYDYVLRSKNKGVNIVAINCNWYCESKVKDKSTLLSSINAIGSKGILTICPAGKGCDDNDGVDLDAEMKKGTQIEPACLDSRYIISVGAIGKDAKKTYYSNYGRTTVDVMAPGEDVLTLFSVKIDMESWGSEIEDTGTDIAAAMVTGSVALLAAYSKKNVLNWTALDIKNRIIGGSNHAEPELIGESLSDGYLDLGIAIDNPQPVVREVKVSGKDLTITGAFFGDGGVAYPQNEKGDFLFDSWGVTSWGDTEIKVKINKEYRGYLDLTITRANDLKSGRNIFNLKTGSDIKSWEENEQSKFQYIDDEGNYLTGWHNNIPGYEGKWFYFDVESYMVTGWNFIDGVWYYFSEAGDSDKGVMRTGWFKDPADGKWYYFSKDASGVNEENLGKMIVGWFQDPEDGAWYYFNDVSDDDEVLGEMETGWVLDEGEWYYLSEDDSNNEENLGKMFVGTQIIDGKTYEFNNDGVCAIGL